MTPPKLGQILGFQTEQARHNNVMHAKPDLRAFLKWKIAGSGSVITDVMRLGVNGYDFSLYC